MDSALHFEAGLAAAADGLELAQREAANSLWIAAGLVLAVQGALIAALSSYDTSDVQDVTDPADPNRHAPIQLLLRRAQSSAVLNAPERLQLSRADLAAIERVIAARNALLHAEMRRPDLRDEDARVVLNVLHHLLIAAPAFPDHVQSLNIARARAALKVLAQRFGLAS